MPNFDLPQIPPQDDPFADGSRFPDPDLQRELEWLFREADVVLEKLRRLPEQGSRPLVIQAHEILGRLRFELRRLEPKRR